MNKLLRLREVCTRVSLSRPAIYRAIAAGKFPKPCKPLSGRASAWSEAEVNAWIEARLAERAA
jgi:prophage regulatory protein